MDTLERKQKLQTLPWYALHEIAKKMCIDEKEINGKEKSVIISKILSYGGLSDEEIEQYVNDYIYGDRVTFTLWTFGSKLEASDYEIIKKLENKEEYIDLSGYRKLKILSVKEYLDRIEILYVYSREYMYIDENGKNANIWEQHRGCLWIGRTETYLACISKHEKMTIYITKYIADVLKNSIVQIKPPKSAIDKCTNFKAISRIVLQGKDGEKTIVSRAGGITIEQEEEIDRIRNDRMDTSGSFISSITSDIEATIKYNVRNGSIGIYKHLPAQVLFKWSENAIGIILEEIENLKGQPAEEIFKEVGQEIKWTGVSTSEITQLNWYLTQVIAALARYGTVFSKYQGERLEEMVYQMFREKHFPYITGQYLPDGDLPERNCDMILEGSERVMFVEIKKCPLPGSYEQADDVDVLKTLGEGMLYAQEQILWHKLRLKEKGALVLYDKERNYLQDYTPGKKKIIAMSICMPEYDFLTDRMMTETFLESTLRVTYHAIDPSREKVLNKLNKRVANIQMVTARLFAGEKYTTRDVFFDSMFRSLQQVWTMLRMCDSLDMFLDMCDTQLVVITGAGDVYVDILSALHLHQSRSNKSLV